MPSRRTLGALVRACHPGPTVAVTVLAGLLAVGAGAGPALVALVVAAVLTGQLVIGWSNDLLDLGRDTAAGRPDKPLARGELRPVVLRRALVVAAAATVVLSALLGWAAGLVHVLLVVGSGVAYNLGLKGTAASWVPYAVAFGSLPQVAWLAAGHPGVADPGGADPGVVDAVGGMPSAPWWMSAAGALLGVGAHLLNVLPDLAEDAQQGVRGFPHRLGARRIRALSPALLLLGVVLATREGPVLVVAGLLAVLAWTLPGRWPFLLSMAMALLAAAALVTA